MIIEHVSHSRLGLFNQCNYRYKLKYHDKIKIIEYKDYLEFGSYVHLVFELFVKNKISLKEASSIAIEEFNKFGSEHKRNIPKIFRNFEEFNRNIYDGNILRDETETEFNVRISDFLFNGRIDRSIFYDNKKLLIVDYKSSNPKNEMDKEKAKKEGQLAKYVYMANKMYDIPIENIWGMMFYVLSGNKVLVSFKRNEVENHIDESVETAKKINLMEPQNAKAKISPLCGHCEYRHVCQPYQKYLTIRQR